MNSQPFGKFANKKNNAAVKEKFKQEKKAAKKKRAKEIEEMFERKRAVRQERAEHASRPSPETARGKQPFGKKEGTRPAPDKRSRLEKPVEQAGRAVQPNEQLTEMPLNKYIAHCGVCSRREAVGVIADGRVQVNGNVVREPGFKVTHKDNVTLNGKKLFVTKNLVYVLLNKPKDYITTTDDPHNRKTVLQLVQKATDQRVYPVGRLDRNTTGVLLLTNDGELTQKLTHPSFEVPKVYQVTLDKPLTKAHFENIVTGITLDDGPIHADALGHPDPKNKTIVGIELHSGKNRIVRRIFESLGYEVRGLDRVVYANLTKKNVERGRWRYLTASEVRQLKFLNKSKGKK